MKSLLVRVSSFVAAGSSLLVAAPAFAQPESECGSDADCEHGYECQVTAVSGCAAPAAPPCDPDGDCVAPEPIDCETQEWTSCVPASGCAEDGDCAEGMVCVSSQSMTCSDVACSPDGECPEPACETETYSQCTQPWNAPCEVAADCGEGFDCVYYEECSCSGAEADPASPTPDPGAAPEPASDADAAEAAPANPATPVAPLPLDPNCECRQSETGSCQLQEVECEADSDCPAEWTCQPVYTDASGGGTSGEAPAGEPDVAPGSDQRMPPDEDLIAPVEPLPPADDSSGEDPKEPPPSQDGGASPPPPDAPTRSLCMPPGYYGSPPTAGETPTSGGDTGGQSGEETDPATPPAPEPAPLEDAGAPLPAEPTDEEPGSDEDPDAPDTNAPETDDEAPSGSESDEDSEGDEPAQDEVDGPELSPVAEEDDAASDGCAVAQTGSNANSFALGLLGLAGLALARRRRS